MPQIRPISDLRNNFTEISRLVHEQKEPVYLTKNGYGDMVVMSMEQFDALQQERRIDAALRLSDQEAAVQPAVRDFEDATAELRRKIAAKTEGSNA